MNPQELPKLLRFYLACVEAEDRKSLRKKLNSIHHSTVSLWDKTEPFFHPDAIEVIFEADSISDRKILDAGTPLARGHERFYYGYPMYLDREGFISPLFVAEMTVEQQHPGLYTMRPSETGDLQLNHHLFRAQHAAPEEMRSIQEELEGEFGSFADRLRAAFERFDTPFPGFPRDQLAPYPQDADPRGCWINRPILFQSERSPYTHHLRYELEFLSKRRDLANDAARTALGAFFAVPTTGGRKAEKLVQFLPVLPLNHSQELAAKAGLVEPLGVVTGPPGTGKSQVVVDLLASYAAAGRPVIFASKNNKAVDVVRERLRTLLGEDHDFTLRLGSGENMAKAQEEMIARLHRLAISNAEQMQCPKPATRNAIEEQVTELHQKIEALETAQKAVLVLEQQCRLLEGNLCDLRVVAANWPRDLVVRIDPIQVKPSLALLEMLTGSKKPTLWFRVRRLFWPRGMDRQLRLALDSLAEAFRGRYPAFEHHFKEALSENFDHKVSETYTRLHRFFQELSWLDSWRGAVAHFDQTSKRLAEMESSETLAKGLEDLLRQRSELACQQFRATWSNRITQGATAVQHALTSYFNLSDRARQSRGDSFLPIYRQFTDSVRTLANWLPIWIVTNLSTRRSVPLEPALFDLLIIDEASQCDIPSALPLLFRAKRALIIGDPKQLSHISTLSSGDEALEAKAHQVEHLLASWSYNKMSLFNLAEGHLLKNGREATFLAEHYRSHPEIIEFSNQAFYSGQLILRTALGPLERRVGENAMGVFWHDVKGSVPQSSKSATNLIEVRAIVELLNSWWSKGMLANPEMTLGVVTPFRLQVERLKAAIQNCHWFETIKERLIIGTAHTFQGNECDLVIFSPVVAKGMAPRLIHWVAETDQLLNVALTRARAALHVVGDRTACRASGSHLGQFASSTSKSFSNSNTGDFKTPAEEQVAELLKNAGLWFKPQHPIGNRRLDFLVVSPFGTRFDLEVDGRGHLTEAALREDAIRDAQIHSKGIRVVRLDARRVFRNPDYIQTLLSRLA